MSSFMFHSKNTDYQYTISVHVPCKQQPEEGFPVIYILDGLSYFPFAKQVIKLQSKNSLKTEVEDSIVVGIYHQEETMSVRRFYDFTSPAEEYKFPEHTKGKLDHIKEVGGAENFSRFLIDELKTAIESQYPVNVNKQTIYGHSLAGYYVLWNYLTEPKAFQTHIAVSPSIWWNGKEIVDLLKATASEKFGPIFIIVGEKEGVMVEDAKQFFEELKCEMKELYIAQDENHASVVPSTLSRAFRFSTGVNNK